MRSSRRLAVALVACATFVDTTAYSIAVPVLPDLGRRLGASPTLIGLLFSSFGATLLATSIPMGVFSDRVGRKGPLVAGLLALAVSTLLFGVAERLPALFAARLVQGAADAITWVVGFALLADLFGPSERGRVMGIAMAAASFGFIVGPALGGSLYELGGVQLPFFALAAASAAVAAPVAWMRLPAPDRSEHSFADIGSMLWTWPVALCAVAVAIVGGTLAMIEPVLSMFLSTRFGAGPARIGFVFGVAAVVAAVLHPVFGRLGDRVGARRLAMAGLVATGLMLPLLSHAWSFASAVALNAAQAAAVAIAITPSLAYMAEVVSATGSESFGVAFGVYNFAWAVGILVGPAMGGFLFERIGFGRLTLFWAPVVMASALALVRPSDPSGAAGNTSGTSLGSAVKR